MVRSENKYLTLGIWVFDFVQRDGKGIGRHTLVRCSSPAKPPSLNEQRAAQLALLSPLGKEDRGREKEQRSRGKGGCCRTSWTRAAAGQGSVEDWRAPHRPTASRAAAGVAKGRRWNLGEEGKPIVHHVGPGAGGVHRSG